MKAKLIRKIPKEEQVHSWERYEFECIRCGRHYTRTRIDPRTVPYCGYCEKQVNREKIIERQGKKERDLVNAVLGKIRAEVETMFEHTTQDTYWDGYDSCRNDVLNIIDKYKAESEE